MNSYLGAYAYLLSVGMIDKEILFFNNILETIFEMINRSFTFVIKKLNIFSLRKDAYNFLNCDSGEWRS